MKNLFAAASYSFNNFYNNLNTQGQMIFSAIMFLIVILCALLLITYVIQGVQARIKIKKIKESNEKQDVVKPAQTPVEKEPVKEVIETLEEATYTEEKTEIIDIAKRVEDALNEESPINFTSFEEDQEKTAIISIDELMTRAKELELIEDEEPSGINYLEKYNLEPAEVVSKETSAEVKAFKVSQVISPIYGVKKEVIDKGNN